MYKIEKVLTFTKPYGSTDILKREEICESSDFIKICREACNVCNYTDLELSQIEEWKKEIEEKGKISLSTYKNRDELIEGYRLKLQHYLYDDEYDPYI